MSTSPRRYHRGDVPERVLDAARELLEQTPAAQISVRELARAAGVSHAAPSRHFHDRAGFLVALAERCFREFVAVQRSAFDDAPPGEKLLAVGVAYVDFACDHPHAFALIFEPGLDPNGGAPAAHAAVIDEHTALLAAALDDAAAAGRLSDGASAPEVGLALWSAAHGLAALAISGRLDRAQAAPVLGALLRATPPATDGSDER